MSEEQQKLHFKAYNLGVLVN